KRGGWCRDDGAGRGVHQELEGKRAARHQTTSRTVVREVRRPFPPPRFGARDGLPGPRSERGQYRLPVLSKREREMPDVTFVQHRSRVDPAVIGGENGRQIRPEREEPKR